MRIDVSERKQCGCVTCIHHRTPWMLTAQEEECGCFNCIQHRTSPIFNTRETEPRNVIGSSVTSVPASSGLVQAFVGESPALASTSTSSPVHTSSPISSGAATATPLAPPVTTSVSSEPAQQPIDSKDGPVDASATSTTSAPVQSYSPSMFGTYPFAFAAPKFSLFGSGEPPVTDVFSSGASATPSFGFGSPATCTSSTSSPFDAPSPWGWGSMQAPVQTSAPNTSAPFSFSPAQDSGKAASASPSLFARPDVGISPAITTPTPSPFDTPSPWGSMQTPSSTFAFPSVFSDRGGFGRPDVGISPAITTPTPTGSFRFSPPFGVCAPGFSPPFRGLPGYGVNYSRYHSNPFGPNPQTTTPFSGGGSFWPPVHAEQGSRYPRYAPTPDLDDPRFHGELISISASNSHGNKSHEELRWEDYKNGNKGARPNAFLSSSNVSPSLFASPSIPTHPQRTTVGTTQANMTGFPFSHTVPTAVERPHEAAGVSSPASGCTACGATSSSSASGYLGFNVATNPPSAATSLPGFFFPTSGSYPMMFGTPSAFQAYPMMFGTQNLAAQGTTSAVQAYLVNGFIFIPAIPMNLQ